MKKIIFSILFASLILLTSGIEGEITKVTEKGVMIKNEYGEVFIPFNNLQHNQRMKYDKNYKKKIKEQEEKNKYEEQQYKLCLILDQLLEFKNSLIFHFYGFSKAGPYNKWLKQINKKIITAIDIMNLGYEYCSSRGQETKYTNLMLPEIKKSIPYETYLHSHRRKKQKEEIRIQVCILLCRFLNFNRNSIYQEETETYSDEYKLFVKDVEKLYCNTYSENAENLFTLSIKHRYYQQHQDQKENLINTIKQNIRYDEYIEKENKKFKSKHIKTKTFFNQKSIHGNTNHI